MPATIETLPADAWPTIARFLPSTDLFTLARSNRWAWRSFSHDNFWLPRLARDDAAAIVAQHSARPHDDSNNDCEDDDNSELTALRSYMRAFSIEFKGLPKNILTSTRGSAVDLENVLYRPLVIQRSAFSFDVWFSLHDSNATGNDSGVYTGGVIFGGQSVNFRVDQWADYHQQFALVSSDRKLYCSVLAAKPKIASDLELRRWYHLALSFDQETQHVYLDGALVSTLRGRLHYEWHCMNAFQIGSGCITAGELNFPRPSSCGWYPFHGLIDDFRVWQSALSHDEVQALARGGATTNAHVREPLYGMKRDLAFYPAAFAERVGCSRPHERVVTMLRGPVTSQAQLLRSSSDAGDGTLTSEQMSQLPATTRASRRDQNRWQEQRRAAMRERSNE